MQFIGAVDQAQALDGESPIDDGQHDMAGLGRYRPIDHHLVTLDDVRAAHAPAGHIEQEGTGDAIHEILIQI